MRSTVRALAAPAHRFELRDGVLERCAACAAGRQRATSGRAPRRPTGRRRSASPAATPRDTSTAGKGSRRVAVAVIASAARAPNTSPSSSELLASRLAPCTPVQATSPAANRPGDRRAAVEVGFDAAHDVVRRRAHRNAIAREIEAGVRARLRDGRKAAPDELRVEMRHRQVDRRAGALALRGRCARDTRSRDARSPAGSYRFMNALAGVVDQLRAFAAQRLGQQEPRRALRRSARSDETGRTRGRRRARRPRAAIAMPSPVAIAGFVVSRKTWPAPPVASSVRCGVDACPASPPTVTNSGAAALAVAHHQLRRARVIEHADARVRR